MLVGMLAMHGPAPLFFAAVAFTFSVNVGYEQSQRNIWERQYADRSAEAMAAQFENPSRPVFRHRADIVALLDLRPGMAVAEIGAGSGFLSRMIAQKVGPSGRVVATELDDKMVSYMNRRAAKEALTNFTAVKGAPTATGLQPRSVDAVVIVNTYSFFDRPGEMLQSVARSLRPRGLLVIVDFPREGTGRTATGVNATDVIRTAAETGFSLLDESSAIPQHYALRFQYRDAH